MSDAITNGSLNTDRDNHLAKLRAELEYSSRKHDELVNALSDPLPPYIPDHSRALMHEQMLSLKRHCEMTSALIKIIDE